MGFMFFDYLANNSAIFIPESTLTSNSYILADLECASGTTSISSKDLLFLTPVQYQDQLNNALVYAPGHWKLETSIGNYFDLESFTGGVFTCRMPNEKGINLYTSVGIYPENYQKNSK